MANRTLAVLCALALPAASALVYSARAPAARSRCLGLPRMSAEPPVGGLLYSLLHLGGFAGDLAYYTSRCSGASRVLELGCGDGRVAAALCLGENSSTVLQLATGDAAAREPRELQLPLASQVAEYVGVELCDELAVKATERLAGARAKVEILRADFHAPLPEGVAPFDAVVVSANTLFCTERHDELVERCAQVLVPGGLLLFDVYNALPWHEDGLDAAAEASQATGGEAGHGSGEAQAAAGGAAGGAAGEEAADLLVRVRDESAFEWSVFEHDPEIDAFDQTIVCRYDFVPTTAAAAAEVGAGGSDLAAATFARSATASEAEAPRYTERLVHHYALPEQLLVLLDGAGFEVDSADGDFGGTPFNEQESEHLVVAARLRPR